MPKAPELSEEEQFQLLRKRGDDLLEKEEELRRQRKELEYAEQDFVTHRRKSIDFMESALASFPSEGLFWSGIYDENRFRTDQFEFRWEDCSDQLDRERKQLNQDQLDLEAERRDFYRSH